MRFDLTGLLPGSRIAVSVELRKESRVIARSEAQAECGPSRMLLALGNRDLPPGNYVLSARTPGRLMAASNSIRLIPSPWQEGATPSNSGAA
ncbi:MAG: hypothetical protein IT210_08625 [Armatimonadetes bacterium]|nr:hypothetical protein [Armatimonadota bacterium]